MQEHEKWILPRIQTWQERVCSHKAASQGWWVTLQQILGKTGKTPTSLLGSPEIVLKCLVIHVLPHFPQRLKSTGWKPAKIHDKMSHFQMSKRYQDILKLFFIRTSLVHVLVLCSVFFISFISGEAEKARWKLLESDLSSLATQEAKLDNLIAAQPALARRTKRLRRIWC